MIKFLLSLFMVIKDIKDELISNTPDYILVSSNKELILKLKKLGVDPNKVIQFETGNTVKNWDKVMTVFQSDNKVYAHSQKVESELTANLASI